MVYKLCILLVFTIAYLTTANEIELDTVVQRKPPGLGAPKKLWWAKEITPDYHVSGRLTERQIKYAADGGFKSLVSLFRYKFNCGFGGEKLPTSEEAGEIAAKAGLQYKAIIGQTDDFASVETVGLLSEALSQLQKPVLLYCGRGYAVTFVTLMYMANLTRHNPSYTPRISSEEFYRMAKAMGQDYTVDFTKEVVAEITGESIVNHPVKPNAEPKSWNKYWLAHPVYANWFTAGQIRRGHWKNIRKARFVSVINMRDGVVDNGKPSQEAVTLINIKDGTPTYGNDTIGPRQNPETLKTLVIDPNKPDNYVINGDSMGKYETRNPGEYGDDIGYNEDLERAHFDKLSLKYYHMPMASNVTFSVELFEKYKDKLLEIGRSGPVLVHCARARRVAYMTVLAAAIQYGKDMNWALKRVRELGFYVSQTKQKDVYQMFSAYLNPAYK